MFLQISDTHIGFNKEANPDVAGTLRQALDKVNALPRPPALILHTGDVKFIFHGPPSSIRRTSFCRS